MISFPLVTVTLSWGFPVHTHPCGFVIMPLMISVSPSLLPSFLIITLKVILMLSVSFLHGLNRSYPLTELGVFLGQLFEILFVFLVQFFNLV